MLAPSAKTKGLAVIIQLQIHIRLIDLSGGN